MSVITSTLDITDGTTTVHLNGSNGTGTAAFTAYRPQPHAQGKQTVDETVEVRFHDTHVADVVATIRSLELLLAEAINSGDSDDLGPRVYAQFRYDQTGTLYRAQITDGYVDYDKDTLSVGYLRAGTLIVKIDWTHVEWEADAEVELTTAGGIAIMNHDDAGTGHDNFIDISGALITGVSWAPCRVAITNTYAVGLLAKVFVAVNSQKGTAFPVHTLEGESATGMTSEADASYASSGNRGKYQLATTAQELAGRWALSTSEIAKYACHWFHPILRNTGGNAGIYAQLKVTNVGSTTVISEGKEVLLSANELADLDVLQVPAGKPGTTALQAADLCLYARGTVAAYIKVDCVSMFGTDGFRVLTPIGDGIAQNGILNDDSSLGYAWVEDGSGNKSYRYTAEGAPIQLFPGRDHRLYFAAMNTANVAEIARTFTVKVYCRPRLFTL